jgi:peroxiredoxin
MSTRNQLSRFSQQLFGIVTLLAAGPHLFAQVQEPEAFPLLKSCGEGSEIVSKLGSADAVKIRYSFATDTGTCYSVTATIEGKDVNGYLESRTHAGNASVHPAIMAFEQDIRLHGPVIPPPPPPAPPAPVPAAAPQAASAAAPAVSKETAPEPTPPLSFAGFRAADISGNRVDFSAKQTPNIVIYFWSAGNPRGVAKADTMTHVYNTFHNRGVDVVGVASARNATQLLDVCRNNEVVWPQILDSGGIANRYHVDPAKPYLVLDRSRNVIAAVASPLELEPVLRPLTQQRKVSQ